MEKRTFKTEGEKIIRKLEFRKYLAEFSKILVILYLLVSQVTGGAMNIFILPSLIVFAVVCIGWDSYSGRQITRTLTRDLDPRLFKEIIEFKRSKASKQGDKHAYSVHAAEALVWQGYTKNAFQVIGQVDFEQIPRELVYEGYLVCCHYFFELKNVTLLKKMKALYDEELAMEELPYKYRQLSEASVCTVNLYLSILEGNWKKFEDCLSKYEKGVDSSLKKVFARYLYMLMCIRAGRMEDASSAARDIVNRGGKLCLVKRAQRVGEEIAKGRTVWETYGPVYNVSWDPDKLIKQGIDYAYFRKNKTYDLRMRMVYAVVIPIAFFAGFVLGAYRGISIKQAEVYNLLSVMSGVSYMLNANAFLLLIKIFFDRRGKKFFTILLMIGIFYFERFVLLGGIAVIPYYIVNAVKLAQEWSQNLRIRKEERR